MAPTERRQPGARPLHLPDWPFGAVSRRLLLEALLRDLQPQDGWRKKDLETRTGVTNGGLDVLLAGAVDLGLATVSDGRVQRAATLPAIAEPLGALVDHARGLPDRPPRPLPRRPYRRSG